MLTTRAMNKPSYLRTQLSGGEVARLYDSGGCATTS